MSIDDWRKNQDATRPQLEFRVPDLETLRQRVIHAARDGLQAAKSNEPRAVRPDLCELCMVYGGHDDECPWAPIEAALEELDRALASTSSQVGGPVEAAAEAERR